ncbi:MAG: 2-dehydropantoate 2-reductase [Pseudoclavibacter sp.]
MRYTVIGAGAMGLRFGVMLQEAGFEVDFVDTWQRNLDTIRAQGGVMVARDHEGRHLVPIRVFAPEEYAGDPDVWIVFVKQMQLEGMLTRCAHLFRDHQRVFTAMNGMGHLPRLQQYFPPERIVAGTAVIATVLVGPGDVDFMGAFGSEHTSLVNVSERDDDQVRALEADFRAAGLGPEVSTNCLGTLLAKVVFNSVSNSICTMFRINVGTFGTDPGAEAMTRQLVDEAYDAIERAGIVPVQTRAEAIGGILHACRDLLPQHYPSMYQDFVSGRPTEVDAINGYLADLGRRHGSPSPTQEVLTRRGHLAAAAREAHVATAPAQP